ITEERHTARRSDWRTSSAPATTPAYSPAAHDRRTPATSTTARHTRKDTPAKKTSNVSAGTITGSSTKPAGPSNTTTASTSGPPPTDTATTANPTPSPNQHHPHHRPCRQTNHHHSERVLFRVGLTCGDAELWTAPRTAEP